MLPWRNKSESDRKKAILIRCEEIIQDCQRGINDNLKLANLWGRVHIILGLTTVFFSTTSAVLTFYDKLELVATVASLSALSAAFLTFLNPSRRETKRRIKYTKFLVFINQAKNFQITIDSSPTSLKEKLKELENLTAQFELLTQELLKLD